MKTKPTYQELEKENEILRIKIKNKKKELQKEISYLDNILLSSTEMSIVATDIDLNITFFNPRAEQIFGYKASELIGKNITEIPDMKEVEFSRIEKAIATVKKTGKYEYYVSSETPEDTKHLKSTINGIWDKEKKLVGFVLFTNDITKQINSRKGIKKLSTAVEQSANLILITDTDGNIEYTNPKFTELTGYTEEEVFGQNTRMLSAGTLPKEYFTELWETISAGKIWRGEIHNKTKAGDLFWENTTITPIKNKTGKIINYLAIKEDITAKKLAEQKLKAQNEKYEALNEILTQTNEELIKAKEKAEESDRLKTEFINNMSHEIRTPMNGIMGFCHLLNNQDLTDEKRKHYINIIKNSGNQLMRIIDDILEISKLGTKQVKPQYGEVCLNDLLLEQFSIFDIKAKENKIPLYFKKGLPDKESTILTDETKLNKILSNLLENALKFTNTGFIEFGYQLKNNYIEIYVKDTGTGIKPEKQEIIFERFSQEEKGLSEKVSGLGLGLSIAKENAELINGKITLKSEKERGSTFFVTIPYEPVYSDIEINKSGKTLENKQNEYTVLIVEDEEINYLYLEILLENFELNIKTIHAKHGQEAVEICRIRQDIGLVLMDLKMSIMNGYEATKLIKDFRPDLPVIAQTAYSTREEKNKAKLAGCDDFISKPINEKTFNGIINKYCYV